MAFCTNCGSKLQNGATFCTSCGTRVDAENVAGYVNAEKSAQTPESEAGHASQPSQTALDQVSPPVNTSEVMIRAASGLSIAAAVLTFFPWAEALWGLISFSGFRAAFMFKDFGFVSFLCLAYLFIAGFAAVRGVIYFLGSSTGTRTRSAIMISMIAGFVLLLIITFKVKGDTHGIDIFTGWYYIEMLVTAAAAGSAFAYKGKV
jgi:hypothetical protein